MAQQLDWTVIGYYYAPIPFYNGRVLKHEGGAVAHNVAHMMAQPGMVMLHEYKGDRITADTHQPFAGV